MSDYDVAQHLREYAQSWRNPPPLPANFQIKPGNPMAQLLESAASEIGRLRSELATKDAHIEKLLQCQPENPSVSKDPRKSDISKDFFK